MRVLEFYDRALKGERIEEKEFDMHILPSKLKELVREYDISFDSEEPVPQDLAMAKRTFDAGLELLTEVGVYCNSTRSVIPIYEEEIRDALRNAPTNHIIGEGAEAVECYHRNIGDKRRPRLMGGPQGAPLSEENYVDILVSYAMEPIDGLYTGALQSVFGRKVRANEPVELMACIREALWGREAVRRAGKPGLCLVGTMSGVSSEAQNAGDFPGGFRPSDLHLISFSNELKVNWGDFKKIIHNQNRGNLIEAASTPMLGGYCGGPEGSAVTGIAEVMQGFVMARAMSFTSNIMGLRFGWSSTQAIWANCMLLLALNAAGVDVILAMYLCGSAGPCTEMLCNELAAQAIAQTASGVSTICGAVGGEAATLDHATGMESRIVYEVSQAAAGMELSEANRVVKALLGKYEEALKNGQIPRGKTFRECYQLDLKPSPEYLDIWQKQKEELNSMGMGLA